MKDARDRLIAAINSIIAQANVVEVMEEGTTKVDLATTPEAKDQSIKENIQNVQIAQAKADEASMMNRIIAGVKTTVSMPGDYIFGPERTKAKTAFEATVGAAVLGALAYLSYTYAPGAMEYVKDLYGRFMGTGAEGQKFELSPRQKEKLGAFSEAVYSEGKTIPEYPGTTPSERELRAGEQITAAVEQAVQAVSESEIAKALLDAQERAVKALSESPTAQRRIEAVGRGGEIIPETGRSVGAFYEW